MTSILLIWGIGAFAMSALATGVVRDVAVRFGVVDRATEERKVHRGAVPLLGGVAIFVTVAACVIALLVSGDRLTGGEIEQGHYVGFLLGGLILMMGGFLDDKFNLPPKFAIVAPVLAALTAIGFGVEVEKLTNPAGGILELEPWQSDVLVFVWLLIVMYTTKFLDGLDGLATGVSTIGSAMILGLSLTVAYFQPDVALLSTIAVGAMLGFLVWNFHPAKIFLGEGGSTFVGYVVGTLAVISGGKLATAMLVIAIPFLDVVWVVIRRWRAGGWKNIFKGDRKHLHHRLLDRGWGQRKIVLAYGAVATVFGGAALVLQSREKLIAFGVLGVLMVIIAIALSRDRHAPAKLS